MYKSTFFTGQPIFNQVLKFLPRDKISSISKRNGADRYCKRFTTYDHLVTLLYSTLNNCCSLREVTTGLLAWEQRVRHLGLMQCPRRSTLSDANNRRQAAVFEEIYLVLLEKYGKLLPDSRFKNKSNLYVFDSTSITLFQDVLRCTGLVPLNGKRKGGIKVHTLIKADQDVPCFIKFSSAVSNDSAFLKDIRLPKGSIILFDRGYFNYAVFNDFTNNSITWITRKRATAAYRLLEQRSITAENREAGVINDEVIVLGTLNGSHRVKSRLISFRDSSSGKIYEFLTNNLKASPLTIAKLYKKRWQIETLFKRLKQNYPLKYFLGDSENAIKIQIWGALIADLLLKIIKNQAARKCSFSNLVSMIRQHMMTYIDLFAFLKSPERSLLKRNNAKPTINFTLSLFDP